MLETDDKRLQRSHKTRSERHIVCTVSFGRIGLCDGGTRCTSARDAAVSAVLEHEFALCGAMGLGLERERNR